MDISPEVKATQWLLTAEKQEPSIKECSDWVKQGLRLYVKPDEQGFYQGLRAPQIGLSSSTGAEPVSISE